MSLHKIRHAVAVWTNLDGSPGMAFRGQVADIPDGPQLDRLKKHFAVIGPEEEVEHPGVLENLPQSPTDEEILNWISNANASEVRAMVAKRPELTPRIEGALTNVKAARAYEDSHLDGIRLAIQQGGLKPDDDDIVLGSSQRSGYDPTDTSADGDNSDIIVSPSVRTPPPAGGDTSLDKAGATIVPPEVTSPTTEDNTGLKDADGTSASLPPIDHSVLVEGSGQDVANYIAAHPEQAEAILDAETTHSQGSPRVEVVNAVRAATGFTSN